MLSPVTGGTATKTAPLVSSGAALQVDSEGFSAYFFISLLPSAGDPSFDISFFGLFLSPDMPVVLFIEPLSIDPLFIEPLSIVPLVMPGLFMLSPCGAGPVEP